MKHVKALLIFFVCLIILTPVLAAESISFTAEEIEYLQTQRPIPTVIIDGAAPLSYVDKKGTIQGIGKAVMDYISTETGLIFEYHVASSTKEYFSSDVLLGVGVTPPYVPAWVTTSTPYLRSETIIVAHEEFDPALIGQKSFASLAQNTYPEGINKDLVRIYNTREEALNAVERGEVDFTYGNAFSVAYYALRNGYKNIIMIPQKMEERAYSIGLFKDDPILLSIINKTLASIDEGRMQTLILGVASNIEQKLTLSQIIRAYPILINSIFIFILAILLINVIITMQANSRYQSLADLSNEFFFEYWPIRDRLTCSQKCTQLFATKNYAKVGMQAIKEAVTAAKEGVTKEYLALTIDEGVTKTFTVVLHHRPQSRFFTKVVAGKLIDVSDQVHEKQTLLKRLEADGLTGLYNPLATKERILARLEAKDENAVDALFLIDIDSFKAINDTYGHLFGDSVLQHISSALKSTFRSSDIAGRIGGDEFCAYISNIPDESLLVEKVQDLLAPLNQPFENISVSVSVGITTTRPTDTYETLFKRADDALYYAKNTQQPYVITL